MIWRFSLHPSGQYGGKYCSAPLVKIIGDINITHYNCLYNTSPLPSSLPRSSSGQPLSGPDRRTSPLREKQSSSFFGKVTNLSQVSVLLCSISPSLTSDTCQVVSAAVSTYTGSYNRERHLTLLVIADNEADW